MEASQGSELQARVKLRGKPMSEEDSSVRGGPQCHKVGSVESRIKDSSHIVPQDGISMGGLVLGLGIYK